MYVYPPESFVSIRSATATCLIIFCAKRGGEPVRLHLYQWNEALYGEWIDKEDIPAYFNTETMFHTYQTGKGGDHLVPVLFPPECIKAMQYLTNNFNQNIPNSLTGFSNYPPYSCWTDSITCCYTYLCVPRAEIPQGNT